LLILQIGVIFLLHADELSEAFFHLEVDAADEVIPVALYRRGVELRVEVLVALSGFDHK
jgi:hypothetical protein